MDSVRNATTRSGAIRTPMSHSIIDCDGHVAEFESVFFDYVAATAAAEPATRAKCGRRMLTRLCGSTPNS
jgi:hypothetical protein